MKKTSTAWTQFYLNNNNSNNFFPDSFVNRILQSTLPVKYLNQDFKNKLILDLGCGHGRNIPFLKSLNFKVTGLEISNEQVVFLKKQFSECNFLKGTSSSIPVEEKSFDYVLACNSIYYLENKNMSIIDNFKECKRVLKKNGIFIFSMVGKKHSILNDSL